MHGFIAARPRFLRRGAAPPLRTRSAFQQGCVFLAIRFGDQHTLSARRDFPEAQVDAEVRGAARAELTASDLPHDAVFSRGVGAEPVPVNLPHRGVARPPIEGGAVQVLDVLARRPHPTLQAYAIGGDDAEVDVAARSEIILDARADGFEHQRLGLLDREIVAVPRLEDCDRGARSRAERRERHGI